MLEEAWIDELRRDLPELPDAKKARFMADFGLTAYDAAVLTADAYQVQKRDESETRMIALTVLGGGTVSNGKESY